MSKIYIIDGKSELTDISKSEITLTFIKKYHKYYPHLLFLPVVLADMIFDYINDIFKMTCVRICRNTIRCHNIIRLNFENVCLNFDISFGSDYVCCRIKRIYDAANKCVMAISSDNTDHINYFLTKYNKKQCVHLDARALELPPVEEAVHYENYYNTIIKNIDNLRHYKNEIMIVKFIYKLIKKN